jgi:hypothetical protein
MYFNQRLIKKVCRRSEIILLTQCRKENEMPHTKLPPFFRPEMNSIKNNLDFSAIIKRLFYITQFLSIKYDALSTIVNA